MKKYINTIIITCLIIVVIIINLTITYLQSFINLNYSRAIALLINIYAILIFANIINTFKFDTSLSIISDNKKSKGTALIIMTILMFGTLIEYYMHSKFLAISNITIFAFIGHYIGYSFRSLKTKIKNSALKREDIITAKEYDKIVDYMRRNEYFMVGDVHEKDIYSINMKFNVKHADKIVSFLQFIISKPEFAYLIGAMFNHIRIEKENVYIDDKLVNNPSEVGLFIFREISKHNEKNKDTTTIKAIIDI